MGRELLQAGAALELGSCGQGAGGIQSGANNPKEENILCDGKGFAFFF